MSPHIMLIDMASVSRKLGYVKNSGSGAEFPMIKKPETSMEDFLSSVEFELAETRPKTDTQHRESQPYGIHDRGHHNHEASDVTQTRNGSATLHGDHRIQPRGNVNRFEIMRDGVFVAVILLERPFFRLGESISAIIDFQKSAVRCHSLMANLESFEIIDPTVALRSQGSIYRATRRIHASRSELTLFEKRATFNLIAPSNATPNFRTSSVSLMWTLRFEFMISQKDFNGIQGEYLGEVVRNERGSVSTGVQMLPCEKFEVSVPLNIYGYVSNPHLKNAVDEISI